MKQIGITLILILFTIQLNAQSNIEALVKQGIQQHDNGDYNSAIETYKKALKLDPKSSLVNYEISLSYFMKKDYIKTIEYSDIVLEQKGEFILNAILTKGSALDLLGKTDESIEMFKKAISEFGEHYLLCYNLALNYYNIKDFENAKKYAQKTLEQKPDHANSLLMLKKINNQNSDLLWELPDSPEEFKNSEPKLLNTINWLENTPINQDVDNRTKQIALQYAWLINTPTITLEINMSVLPFTEKNPELLGIFMGGWAKFSLNNSYSSDILKCNLAGLKSVIDYYKKGNGLKKDIKMEKLIELDNKNQLEDWIKSNLKKK